MRPFLCTVILALSTALAACGGVGKPTRVGQEIKPLWTVPIASFTQPLVSDGLVYLAGFTAGNPDSPYKTYALDAATGQERWSRKSSDWRILAVSGGKLFTLDFDKKVHAVDARTGADVAGIDVSEMTEEFASYENDIFIISGIEKYLLTEKSTVTAMDTLGGKKRWSSPIPKIGPGQNGILVGANADIVILKTQRYEGTATRTAMVGYDRATGRQLWKYDKNFSVRLSRLEKDTAYLVGSESRTQPEGKGTVTFSVDSLTAINLKTGAVRWSRSPCANAVAAVDGVLIVSATGKDDQFKDIAYCAGLDPGTGREIWKTDEFPGPTAGQDNVVLNSLVWVASRERHGDFRKEYDGDRRGSKVQGGFPVAITFSSITGYDHKNHKVVFQSELFPATECSEIRESGGILFFCTRAEMKEGRSGVWAFKITG